MTKYPDIYLKKCNLTSDKIDWFQLIEPCQIHDEMVIPAGYRTDFASVPRWLWSVFPPHGRMANPSVRHDYAYDTQHGQHIYGAEYARKLADRDFLIDMLEAHVPSWQAVFIYAIVRAFGKSWWNK